MSQQDIAEKIEKILSEILSDKHEAKITIKFKKEKIGNGNIGEAECLSKE